jgi:hypothetical protein
LLDIIREDVDVVDPEMQRQSAVDGEGLLGEREDPFEVTVDISQS